MLSSVPWLPCGPQRTLAVDRLLQVCRVWPLAPHASTGDHRLSGGEGTVGSEGSCLSSRDIKTRMKAFQKPVLNPGLSKRQLRRTPVCPPGYCSGSFSGKASSCLPQPYRSSPVTLRKACARAACLQGGCVATNPGHPLASRGPTPFPGGDPACSPPAPSFLVPQAPSGGRCSMWPQ